MIKYSTDLNVIRNSPHLFTWGKVVAFHDVGPYTIVEYKREIQTQPQRALHTSTSYEGVSTFHVYVEGNSTSSSETSLDNALLLAIGLRNCGINEGRHMALAASRCLGTRTFKRTND
jgi:hypothetical protein